MNINSQVKNLRPRDQIKQNSEAGRPGTYLAGEMHFRPIVFISRRSATIHAEAWTHRASNPLAHASLPVIPLGGLWSPAVTLAVDGVEVHKGKPNFHE